MSKLSPPAERAPGALRPARPAPQGPARRAAPPDDRNGRRLPGQQGPARGGLRRALIRAALAVLLAALAALPVSASGRPSAATLEAVIAATVVIRSAEGGQALLGSGFLWGEGGLALTNAHVVGDAPRVLAVFADGRRRLAEVIARDPTRDIAVLDFGGSMGPGLTPAAAAPRLGDSVYALGAPLGIEFTLTQGLVSALARQVEPQLPIRMLQHDAAVNPGSSGGPLVDAEGRLVGMNSRIADGSRLFVGMGFAIPAADLARLLPELLAGRLAPLPRLGLRLRPLEPRLAAALGRGEGGGLLVDHVDPGSLAARAGLEAGDILLAMDGTVLTAPGELAFLLEAAQPRGEARLRVLRGGEEVELLLGLDPPRARLLPVVAGGAAPGRVSAYTLAELGISLDDAGVITRLTANSPATFAGIAEGDRVLALNGRRLTDPAAAEALRALRLEAPAVLLVQRRDGTTQHVLLDPWAEGRGPRPVGGANLLDPEVVLF